MGVNEKFLKLIVVILVLFCVSIMPIVLAEEVNALSYEDQVLNLVNTERSKVGVAPLTMDSDLLNAAKTRNKEITIQFSHTRPSGSQWYTVSSKAYGENIAKGQQTPEEVMDWWMNSPPHKKNILNPKHKIMGISYIGGNSLCWVQLFGIKKVNKLNNNQNKPKTPSLSLANANKQIAVKWTKVPNVSGYQIYRSTSKNGKYVLKKTIPNKNINRFIDRNLQKKKYYYAIRSYKKSNGKIVYSNFSSIKSETPK